MMLEKGKINAGEFHILVIVFTIGTSILVLPATLAKFAKQDAWIASVLTICISLCFIFIYNQLSSLYPSMTFVEISDKIFGKWLGKISALLYLYYFFLLSASLTRQMGDFFTTQVMVETPIQIIMMMFLLTSLMGVRLGLEVISRTAVIFIPWIIVMLFILFVLLLPETKFENIQPIFEGGMKPIVMGVYQNLGVPYLELPIFLMIAPYVTEKLKMKKAFYFGTLIGGFLLSILVIYCILVLGTDMTARQAYPTYILGKKISIGDFIERIEVIVAIIWIFTIYLKLTICYYGVALGLAQLFGLRSYQILTFPLAILLLAFSIIINPDVVYFRYSVSKMWSPYSLTICFFLPLLLLVVGKVRKNFSPAKTTSNS